MENIHEFKNNGETDATNRAMSVLQREYVLIGKTRVRSWKAWLIIGVLLGIIAAVLLVAWRT